MSLRAWLALTIGLLAFLPNLALVLTLGALRQGAWPTLLLWLLVLAGLSAGLGLLLAQSLLRPLEELGRALAYLRLKEGPLSELRLPPPKDPPPKEVARLRQRISELLDRIRSLMEEREAFYAALAHDLRTPILSSIRTLAYLEGASELGREKRVELLRALREELERAQALVQNLLTLARLETQPPARERVNLRALAEDLLLRYRKEAEARGLALALEGTGTAYGERLLLERALANLLDNALRHARTRVGLRLGDGVMEVEDDGPGLPLPLEVLAQPFRQGQGPRGGSGLGLYTVRRVAEAHGGRLSYERGRFRLEVPSRP